MFRQALSALNVYPTISLIIFCSFLLMTLAWIFRPGSKDLYDKVKYFSFDGENHDKT